MEGFLKRRGFPLARFVFPPAGGFGERPGPRMRD